MALRGHGPPKGTKYKKTIDAELIREYWRKRVAEDQSPLYEAMANKAKGCEAIDKRKPGRLVYELPPDPSAFDALMKHVMPRLPQQVQGSGDEGEIIIKVQKFG